MAPGLIDHRRVERHSREPGTFAAGVGIAEVIGTNEPFGNRTSAATVVEFLVGRKVFEKFAGGNFADVAEVNFAEGVAFVMFDVARHIKAEEHGVAGVDGGDFVAGDEIAFARGKDDELGPFRAGVFAGRAYLVFEAAGNGEEAFALNDTRRELFGLRANLRAFDRAFRSLAVIWIVEDVGEIAF